MNVRTPYKQELAVISMMQDMCAAWKTNLSFVSEQARDKGRPMMKRLLCMAAVANFPDAPLSIVAQASGYADHSAVSKGLRQGHLYLMTEAEEFMIFYRQVPQYFEKYNPNGKYTAKVRVPEVKRVTGPEWVHGSTSLPPFYTPLPVITPAGKYDVAAYWPLDKKFKSMIGSYPASQTKWLREPKQK